MSDYGTGRKTYVRELDTVNPSSDAMATVCITNDIIEVKVYDRGFHKDIGRFRKIDKTRYLDVETGEIVRFQSKTGRGGISSSDRYNWNRAFERLRRIINYNFTGSSNELHIILTYGGNLHMTDRGIVSNDFKNFWKRIKYHYGSMEYIVMYEPDCKGRWHIHVLVKNKNIDTLFIDNRSIQDIWSHGFTKVRHTTGNDNIGAYFTVLLGSGKGRKASRIQYYQKYKKLYTKSRGILIPPLYRMTYNEVEKLVSGHNKVYEKGYSVLLENENVEVNRIYIMQYNDRRNGK